jgi:hypothetical protein
MKSLASVPNTPTDPIATTNADFADSASSYEEGDVLAVPTSTFIEPVDLTMEDEEVKVVVDIVDVSRNIEEL